MFLQGSGYANVPNSVITTRFSVMARTYASVLMNLRRLKKKEKVEKIKNPKKIAVLHHSNLHDSILKGQNSLCCKLWLEFYCICALKLIRKFNAQFEICSDISDFCENK